MVNVPPLICHNFRSSCSSRALRKISFKRRQLIYFKNGMKLGTNKLDSKGNNDYFLVRTVN